MQFVVVLFKFNAVLDLLLLVSMRYQLAVLGVEAFV